MSEPAGFSDSGPGNGRRNHHIELNDAERARLRAIESTLRNPPSPMPIVNKIGDTFVISDADGYKLAAFTRAEFEAFVGGIKDGEFDDMVNRTSEGE